jgi:V/A-type H+-transporting ATPase subunit E
MAIEDVKQQLLSEAEAKAKKIVAEADTQVEASTKQIEEEVKTYESHLQKQNEDMLTLHKRKELAQAEFDGKKLLLDAKKELVDQTMEKVQHMLEQLPPAKRKKLNEALLKEASKEITVKQVILAKKDLRTVSKAGIKKITGDITGGLIAETADGKILVDLSVESMLEQIRAEKLQEVSEVLFGE